MRLLERIGISRRNQRRLTWLMQAFLATMAVVGLYNGDMRTVFNSVVPLAVSFLPAILQKDPRTTLDPAITLWVTGAVFMHAIGTYYVYNMITGFDHLTHVLSSTLIAGLGYALVRSFDTYADGIELSQRFIFIFILVFTMAVGVVWEVLEFFAGIVGTRIGHGPVLIQSGMDDTMRDLTFNMVGAVIVAAGGHAYLNGVIELITSTLGLDEQDD